MLNTSAKRLLGGLALVLALCVPAQAQQVIPPTYIGGGAIVLPLVLPNGTSGAPSVTDSTGTTGFYRNTTAQWTFTSAGVPVYLGYGSGTLHGADKSIAFATTADPTQGSVDVSLSRPSTSVLQLSAGDLFQPAGDATSGETLGASNHRWHTIYGENYRVGSSIDFSASAVANRLDLASGDSLYVVSGGIGLTGTATGGIKIGSSGTFTGSGIELTWDGSSGTMRNYNRTGSAYLPMLYDAFSHEFQSGGGGQIQLTITTAGLKAPIAYGSATTTGTLVTNDAQSVANDGVISISAGSNLGYLYVFTGGDDDSCIFQLRGAGNGVFEISDGAGNCSVTSGTASSINVYYSSGYKLENKRGGTRNIRLLRLGV